MQQREVNREKIFEAFKLIPEIVEKAQTMREYYPKEESLQENEIALYDVLLEEIPQLIRILLRKHNASRESESNLPCSSHWLTFTSLEAMGQTDARSRTDSYR